MRRKITELNVLPTNEITNMFKSLIIGFGCLVGLLVICLLIIKFPILLISVVGLELLVFVYLLGELIRS